VHVISPGKSSDESFMGDDGYHVLEVHCLRVFELGLSLASALAPLRQGPLVRLIRTRSMIDESLEAVLACLYIGLAAEAGQKLSSAANLPTR